MHHLGSSELGVVSTIPHSASPQETGGAHCTTALAASMLRGGACVHLHVPTGCILNDANASQGEHCEASWQCLTCWIS